MKQYNRVIDVIRQRHVPDPRAGVFDVAVEQRGDTLVLTGQTTQPAAVAELMASIAPAGDARVLDEIVLLPDPGLGEGRAALVRAAVVPVYAEPRLPAPQISQAVMGMRVDVLSREGSWLRIRGEDGYLGWVQQGYVLLGDREWAAGWERGSAGESVVSLGAELVDEEERILSRPPWGARLVRSAGMYMLPDGRRGTLAAGEVIDVDRLSDRFPPRGESVARTARRWHGAPYLWGGVTPGGVDCSGLSQAVLWMHGVALPRDSDLQAKVGDLIEPGPDFAGLAAGDLAFFAEDGHRVSHVAVCLGGTQIIHSALGNGGVEVNDLLGESEFEQRLSRLFVHARRLLPDPAPADAVL
jgi:hypothetical protein